MSQSQQTPPDPGRQNAVAAVSNTASVSRPGEIESLPPRGGDRQQSNLPDSDWSGLPDEHVDADGPAPIAKKSLRSDLRVLWHLIAHPVRGNSHQERLESFYRGQADDYDSFRSRLLHGRGPLIERLQFPVGGVWADLGAGTGENILRAKQHVGSLNEVILVDLAESLLDVAQRQLADAKIDNASFQLADVTTWDRPDNSVDLVTFSYSLTMVPDWFAAIELAHRILKPGGMIAVTDFYVSRKYASSKHRQHSWATRWFWPAWFAGDNVYLSSDHCAMLHRKFEVQCFCERLGKVPYLPLLRAPYYLFVGKKST
ncbi:Ubiquinone/menaquinone biosynthesis C-methyltransferase UbiE [Stieleria bergensis]|uniref:Ubiquinone/menaquinone biosynthesis C-methyltransferase UbiE n=1 Tax=Stieleria bergensis TaxID=2528025 RepID=A0A517SW79_9BACT|nr:Ubiquinone/menaquinone biosynthesis C-methyltransferase UbiE [Planctomycetes bacterium SV_7m_r]